MNIETSNLKKTNEAGTVVPQKKVQEDSPTNFKEELDNIKEAQIQESDVEVEKSMQEGASQEKTLKDNDLDKELLKNDSSREKLDKDLKNCDSRKEIQQESIISTQIQGKRSNEKLDNAMQGLSEIVKEFNQTDDNTVNIIKDKDFTADNNNMINNDLNVQENKDLLPQMNPNMNFSGDGQPFSSFLKNQGEQSKNKELSSSVSELAEEAAILSTMGENIAIAQKAQVLTGKIENKVNVESDRIQENIFNNTKNLTIINEEGIKKVDVKTGIKVENVVKFDNIVMNEADVKVFADLVQKSDINLNNLTSEEVAKSTQISKTLADLLIKCKENNQPLRIDFDNNISVIIKISRDGKITADFLPSSQVAEAYLKENLPLLRQRFDDNNIKYDELNQRERRDSNRDNNKKKGRNDE